jgi:hypothetical protein
MKKTLALTTVALLIFTLAPYVLSNLRKPLTTVFALGGIESCDKTSITVDTFYPGDQVYVKGSGLEPGGIYYIYIVRDHSSWITSETHISDLDIVEGPITIDVDDEGNIENQPILIWESSNLGHYDIWADSQTNGESGFYDESDALDDVDVNGAGFIVITEILFATVSVLFVFLTLLVALKRRNIFHIKNSWK